MPTYTELVDMVAQLEKKTVVMASMVESKQTRPPPPPPSPPPPPPPPPITSARKASISNIQWAITTLQSHKSDTT